MFWTIVSRIGRAAKVPTRQLNQSGSKAAAIEVNAIEYKVLHFTHHTHYRTTDISMVATPIKHSRIVATTRPATPGKIRVSVRRTLSRRSKPNPLLHEGLRRTVGTTCGVFNVAPENRLFTRIIADGHRI